MTDAALDSMLAAIRALPSLEQRLRALDVAGEALWAERDAQMTAGGGGAHRAAVRRALDRWQRRAARIFPDDVDSAYWEFPVLPREHVDAVEALWAVTRFDAFALRLHQEDRDVLTAMSGSVRGVPLRIEWSYAGGDEGSGGHASVSYGEPPRVRLGYGPGGLREAARAIGEDLPEPLMCGYLFIIGHDHLSPEVPMHAPPFWEDSELTALAREWNAAHGASPLG